MTPMSHTSQRWWFSFMIRWSVRGPPFSIYRRGISRISPQAVTCIPLSRVSEYNLFQTLQCADPASGPHSLFLLQLPSHRHRRPDRPRHRHQRPAPPRPCSPRTLGPPSHSATPYSPSGNPFARSVASSPKCGPFAVISRTPATRLRVFR